MGIRNIRFLFPQPITEAERHLLALQAQAALQSKLMEEHRRGQHPYGLMRRECPMCQTAK